MILNFTILYITNAIQIKNNISIKKNTKNRLVILKRKEYIPVFDSEIEKKVQRKALISHSWTFSSFCKGIMFA